MNLTKILHIAAVSLVVALGFASPSQAAVTVAFSAGSTCGGATQASFSPGGAPVQVSLCMTTTAPTTTCGHTIVLQSAAGESGRFVVTSPMTLGSNYSDPNSEVSQLPLAINNPPLVVDFGGTTSTTMPVASAVNQLLATFNFSPQSNATAASYVISLGSVSIAAVDADGTCGASTVPSESPISAGFTLNRNNAPVFTSANAATFSTTGSNSFTVVATGNPVPTLSNGALPSGVAFNVLSGVLSGTPTAGGPYSISFTASNGVMPDATQTFTLTAAGQAGQMITFTNPGTLTFNSTPIALTATASSGLPVSFTTITSTVCSVTTSGSLTMLTSGTCTIAANQAGNGTYLAASQVLQSFGIAGSVPGAPTIGAATPGNLQVTVAFTAPAATGGSPIQSYTVACSSNAGVGTGTGNSSPITVSGLINGTAYTCSVTATNSLGTGASSGTVMVTPANTALALLAVASRKTHGTAGTFDIPVDFSIANAPGSLVSVESRTAGTGYNVVFQFNGAITAAGSASLSTAGTAMASTTGNNEIVVLVTGIADRTRVTVSLTGVNGGTSASATIGFLIGDQDGSRLVQGGDVSVTRARSGQAANTTNFKADFDASGVIGGGDVSTVRARSGNALP